MKSPVPSLSDLLAGTSMYACTPSNAPLCEIDAVIHAVIAVPGIIAAIAL